MYAGFLFDIGFEMMEYATSESAGSLNVSIVINGSVPSSFNVTVEAVDEIAIGNISLFLLSV